MRNVFDQYTLPENRVTHALMTALHEDRTLLRSFLDTFVGVLPKTPPAGFTITVQSYPGKLEEIDSDSEDLQRKGLPDAWVTIDSEWCLIIENKVLIQATRDQIHRHLRVAKDRLGYQKPKLILLTVREPEENLPVDIIVQKWSTIYKWLRNSKSEWAQKLAQFLVVLEGRMIEKQQLTIGTLTTFDGVMFSHDFPYTYLEAKRILKLVIPDLQRNEDLKGLFSNTSKLWTRGAITGQKDDVIWNVLSPEENFTKCTHLTLGVGRSEINAMVTVPNSIGSHSIRQLKDLGTEGFHHLVADVLRKMSPLLKRCEGMEPRMVARQLRYSSIKAIPFNDAILDFDLRTVDGSGPKRQRQWVDAVYSCIAEKKSNFSFQIGGTFPYRSCKAVQKPEILDRLVEAWCACKPFITALAHR